MLRKGQKVKVTIDNSYFKKGQIVEVYKVVDPVVESIIDKFKQRSEVGIKKYGTTLYENNTDDFLNHLQEELMDAILYIQKLRHDKTKK